MLSVRTLFLSDAHLGFSGSRAEELAAFLGLVRCEKLYLVGDIVDFHRLRSRWHWPASHAAVLHHLLERAQGGTEVVFIPGNHDEAARQITGQVLAGIEIRRHDTHRTRDGRRLWVTHGDEFDLVMRHSRLRSWLGGLAYDTLVWLNHITNGLRRAIGRPHWSLAVSRQVPRWSF